MPDPEKVYLFFVSFSNLSEGLFSSGANIVHSSCVDRVYLVSVKVAIVAVLSIRYDRPRHVV